MNKAVLISIQPKWCELIASGKKTVDVRKTKPKIDVPFKCYIYCTNKKKGDNEWQPYLYLDKSSQYGKPKVRWIDVAFESIFRCEYLHGKVIGEFVCDEITEFSGEFWDDETHEHIMKVIHTVDWDGYPETETYYVAEDGEENYLCNDSCLTWEELRKYMGKGINNFYGWHISDLVIYDNPKVLSKFHRPCEDTKNCLNKNFRTAGHCLDRCFDCGNGITKPPQSWCYVEELKGATT